MDSITGILMQIPFELALLIAVFGAVPAMLMAFDFSIKGSEMIKTIKVSVPFVFGAVGFLSVATHLLK